MKETAGRLGNGIAIATVDTEKNEIHLIVPPGWTVLMLATNSGARLIPTHADGGHPKDIPASGVFAAEIACVQVGPGPSLVEAGDEPPK